MLFKRGNQCLITTIPSNFYPVDGALGMKEIVDVVTEQDSLVQHSVLLDEGEMTADEASSLRPPILEECSPLPPSEESGRQKLTLSRLPLWKVVVLSSFLKSLAGLAVSW